MKGLRGALYELVRTLLITEDPLHLERAFSNLDKVLSDLKRELYYPEWAHLAPKEGPLRPSQT